MTLSSFGSRFGFARWLYHLRTGAAPTHAEIAREVNRTGPAVSAWMEEVEAPVDYRVHGPLARFLGVAEAWLIKNEGKPPRPDLWQAWHAARAVKEPPESLRRAGQAPSSRTASGKRGRSA